MIYIFSEIRISPFSFLVIFLFLLADIFFVTLLVTVRASFTILLLVVKFFNGVSILFAVHTVLVLFSLHKKPNFVPIFTIVVALSLDLTYV